MQNDMQKGEHDHCKQCGHCDSCCSGGFGAMGHRGPLHWVIKVVIAVIIFWLGMQFGELSAAARFPGYMMRGYGYGGYGPSMMYGGYDASGNQYYGGSAAPTATQ
jgi:hypothetical protein